MEAEILTEIYLQIGLWILCSDGEFCAMEKSSVAKRLAAKFPNSKDLEKQLEELASKYEGKKDGLKTSIRKLLQDHQELYQYKKEILDFAALSMIDDGHVCDEETIALKEIESLFEDCEKAS